MKVSVLVASLFMCASLSAQSASKVSVSERLAQVEGSLLNTLETYNEIAFQFQVLESQGLVPHCTYGKSVIGFGNSVEKDALTLALRADALVGNPRLQEAAVVFSDFLVDAAATGCVAVNNKCCKRSNRADVSDTCNPKTNLNCTLTGIRIQGCTGSSNDC